MPKVSQQDVLQELIKGEELLWHGRPGGGIRFRRLDIFLGPFGLMCGSGVILIMVDMVSSGVWVQGVPFLILGLYLMFGRFLFDLYRRKNTIYALTNSRLLIIQNVRTKKVKSINLSFVRKVGIREKKNGSGTIMIDPKTFPFIFMDTKNISPWAFWNGGPLVPSLEYISDVKKVYNLLLSAIDEKNKIPLVRKAP